MTGLTSLDFGILATIVGLGIAPLLVVIYQEWRDVGPQEAAAANRAATQTSFTAANGWRPTRREVELGEAVRGGLQVNDETEGGKK